MRHRFDSGVRKIPWRKAWQSTPLFLLGESLGQRRLAGCSAQGRTELGMTKVTQHTCSKIMYASSLVDRRTIQTWVITTENFILKKKPTCPRAHASQQEKPPQWEAHTQQLERSPCPCLLQLEKGLCSNKEPAQPNTFLKKQKNFLIFSLWEFYFSKKTLILYIAITHLTNFLFLLSTSWLCYCFLLLFHCKHSDIIKH